MTTTTRTEQKVVEITDTDVFRSLIERARGAPCPLTVSRIIAVPSFRGGTDRPEHDRTPDDALSAGRIWSRAARDR